MKKSVVWMFMLLTACHVKSPDNSDQTESHAVEQTLLSDTVKLNGYPFIEVIEDDRFHSLVELNGSVIVKHENYYFKAQYPDIDGDGYTDIRVLFFSNTPNECNNYLFDPELKTFVSILNSNLDITLIGETQYYYSYERAGCSSMNWQSYLSKIENRTEIRLGRMIVNNCDDSRSGVETYRILQDGKEELVETLPITHYRDRNEGANYFKNYWTKNYRAFE